jgi:hypothetical protein
MMSYLPCHRVLIAAKSSLPRSPRKRNVVLSVVTQTLMSHSPISLTMPNLSKPRGFSHRLPEATKAQVLAFFERDDVSRQASGMRDFIRLGMSSVQKRHMCFTIREAYFLFKQEFPDVAIRKSKFANLRPHHVRVQAETSKNVCVCAIHYNFIRCETK